MVVGSRSDKIREPVNVTFMFVSELVYSNNLLTPSVVGSRDPTVSERLINYDVYT